MLRPEVSRVVLGSRLCGPTHRAREPLVLVRVPVLGVVQCVRELHLAAVLRALEVPLGHPDVHLHGSDLFHVVDVGVEVLQQEGYEPEPGQSINQ